MESINTTLSKNTGEITDRAEVFWSLGVTAESEGDFELAYREYRSAHDLIQDIPEQHQVAHEHLRRVNYELKHYKELTIDVIVLALAPFGIFRLISFLSK